MNILRAYKTLLRALYRSLTKQVPRVWILSNSYSYSKGLLPKLLRSRRKKVGYFRAIYELANFVYKPHPPTKKEI